MPEASEGMQEQVWYVSLVLRSALAGDELQRTEVHVKASYKRKAGEN